jgi:serine/threonine protein kinase
VKAFRLDVVPEQIARLADALRKLAAPGHVPNHPGLVPPLDAGLEGTTAYLASEYVAAETLDVALRHLAPAPLDRAVPILAQIADAIDAAWAAGVGHGALHPRDVFVTVDAHTVRVTGVGVVQALESLGIKPPIRRPYMAPERVAGDSWDIRADVYALGAIAHELLTRRRPAGSGEQDGALTTGTSPEQRVQVRRVLSAVLAEHPQHRFRSARAFTDALAAIARGDAPTAVPEAGDADIGPEPEAEPVDFAAAVAIAEPSLRPGPEGPGLRTSEPGLQTSEPEGPEIDSMEPRGFSPGVTVPLPPPPEREPVAQAMEPSSPDMWGPLDVHPDDVPQDVGVPGPLLSEPPRRSAFPWSAVAVVAAAGIALGVALGYLYGRDDPAASGQEFGIASSETEVPVPPEVADVADAGAAMDVVDAAAPRPGGSADDEPAPGPASVARTSAVRGRLVVQSTPPGAMVLVDGRPHGQTPVTLSSVALGRRTVEVARSGYVPYETVVTLTSDASARTLSVRLQPGLPTTTGSAPAPGMGSILVDSRPQAARVLIDGRFVGTTPLRLPEVAVGRHVVSLERAGYGTFSTSVAVRAGEQARVTARLEEQ